MTRPRRIPAWLGVLLLAACLLGAQLALASHGVEHAMHAHDPACVECLSIPGMLAVPAQAARAPMPPAARARLGLAVPPAPTFAFWLGFRSRAPPFLPY